MQEGGAAPPVLVLGRQPWTEQHAMWRGAGAPRVASLGDSGRDPLGWNTSRATVASGGAIGHVRVQVVGSNKTAAFSDVFPTSAARTAMEHLVFTEARASYGIAYQLDIRAFGCMVGGQALTKGHRVGAYVDRGLGVSFWVAGLTSKSMEQSTVCWGELACPRDSWLAPCAICGSEGATDT